MPDPTPRTAILDSRTLAPIGAVAAMVLVLFRMWVSVYSEIERLHALEVRVNNLQMVIDKNDERSSRNEVTMASMQAQIEENKKVSSQNAKTIWTCRDQEKWSLQLANKNRDLSVPGQRECSQ